MATEVMQSSRRTFFRTVGALGAACMLGSLFPPRHAGAAESSAAPAVDINALMKEKIGSDTFTEGRVNVGIKLRPDSSSVIPAPISIDHPQEAGNFIEAVALFVDNNPRPFICKFTFTPEVGQVNFETQFKMARTSKVRVVARNNKGQYFSWVKEVEVLAGSCAG